MLDRSQNKIAIIGGGPAGIQCALTLNRWSFDTISIAKALPGCPIARIPDLGNPIKSAIKIARDNIIEFQTKKLNLIEGMVSSIQYRKSNSNKFVLQVGDDIIDASHVIVACGANTAELDLSTFDDVEYDIEGRIITDDYETGFRNLFAIGEAASGYVRTLSCALGTGDGAARLIAHHLRKTNSRY